LAGSFFFILIQLLYLIDLAHSWTESWVGNYEKTESRFWAFALISVSIVFYILSIVATALMYTYYTQQNTGCWINAMFITLNVIFCFFITCCSVHPKIQEKNPRSGLLQSAIITLYSTYLVYSSVVSEPKEMNCTTLNIDPNSPSAIIMLILGVLFTFIAIIYSALSTGTTNTNETTGLIKEEKDDIEKDKKDDKDLEDPPIEGDTTPVSYSYFFFHICFALAVMYLCMVITNWNLVNEGGELFNVAKSIAPAWIKITSSWVTLLLYLWTLIAPFILKNRQFSRD